MKTVDKEEILRCKITVHLHRNIKMQIKIKIKQFLICKTDPDI